MNKSDVHTDSDSLKNVVLRLPSGERIEIVGYIDSATETVIPDPRYAARIPWNITETGKEWLAQDEQTPEPAPTPKTAKAAKADDDCGCAGKIRKVKGV